MSVIKEYVNKTDVFRTLRQNAISDKKDVYITGIKDGEKFRRVYRYSDKSRKWFIKNPDGSYSKVSKNVPANDVKNLLFKGFTFDTLIEEDDIILITFTDNKDIEESTSTASVGGAYQTPFGGQPIKRKHMNEDNQIVELTESQFEEMVKKTLVYEFVYDSEGGKSTDKNSGKTKSTSKEQIEKADKNQKPNISDKDTATYYKKSNPVARDEDKKEQLDIEAHQNMADLEYDNMPEQAKEQIKKGFEDGGEAGKKLLDQAKKRAKSKDKMKEPLVQKGDDIELSKKKPKNKPTVAETYKKYKLKSKLVLTEEEDLEMFLEQKQKKLKGTVFFLEDFTGNRLKINWTDKQAEIISSRNIIEEAKQKDTFKRLMNSAGNAETKTKVNESDYFNRFFNKIKGVKQMINESDKLDDMTGKKIVEYEFNNMAYDFKMIAKKIEKNFNVQHLNTSLSNEDWSGSYDGYFFYVLMSFKLNDDSNLEVIEDFMKELLDDLEYWDGPGRPYRDRPMLDSTKSGENVLFKFRISGGMDV